MIGIFGGSFNPIHFGHLFLAEFVLKKLKLKKIVFVPCGNPPHKPSIEDKLDRLNMTKLAISDNPMFEVSDFEVNKHEFSFTIDTLKYFDSLYKDFYFIIGSDILSSIHTWKNSEEILNNYKIVVLSRDEHSIKNSLTKNMTCIKMPKVIISSTNIRELIKNNEPIKYLTPEKVINYIYKHNLYAKEGYFGR